MVDKEVLFFVVPIVLFSLWFAFRKKVSIGSAFASLLLLVFGLWFTVAIGVPWLKSFDSVQAIGARAIDAEALDYAEANTQAIAKSNQKVVDDSWKKAEDGDDNIDHTSQRSALRKHGDATFNLDQSRIEAHAAREGRAIGDFFVHANRDVTSDPQTWATPKNKMVCAPGEWVTAWGTANSYRVPGNHLNFEATVQGWIHGDPQVVGGYVKVHPPAPYLALLVQAGLQGKTVYDWKDVGNGQFRVFVPTKSCQMLRWAYNDWDKDAYGTHQSDIFTQNAGGANVTLNPPSQAATQ